MFRERNRCSRTALACPLPFEENLRTDLPSVLIFLSFLGLLMLISPCKNRAAFRGLVAVHAFPAATVLLQWNAAHGGACFFLDFAFAVFSSSSLLIGSY